MKETNLKSKISACSVYLKGVLIASQNNKIVSVVFSDNYKKDVLKMPDFDSFVITNVGSLGDNYKYFNKI